MVTEEESPRFKRTRKCIVYTFHSTAADLKLYRRGFCEGCRWSNLFVGDKLHSGLVSCQCK